ncbi:hypothetical protein [Oleiagrimonas soli]|nr:hypothetical protein [Oleiagrimonas soli]MBB6183952.1 hypothetical protein [Oleiagrimonas soli]
MASMKNEGGKIHLSGPLSEWLFSSKFWFDFNARHGTMFDQFEEDDADVPIVNAIVEALDVKVSFLQNLGVSDIEFVYRWTPEQGFLKISVPRESLLSELVRFRDFLVDAAAKNHCVTLSL